MFFPRINARDLDRFDVFCFGAAIGCAISGNWIAFYLAAAVGVSVWLVIALAAISARRRLKRMGWPGRMV